MDSRYLWYTSKINQLSLFGGHWDITGRQHPPCRRSASHCGAIFRAASKAEWHSVMLQGDKKNVPGVTDHEDPASVLWGSFVCLDSIGLKLRPHNKVQSSKCRGTDQSKVSVKCCQNIQMAVRHSHVVWSVAVNSKSQKVSQVVRSGRQVILQWQMTFLWGCIWSTLALRQSWPFTLSA